jgi:fructose-specific phosphotransferase system IIC component
MAVSQMTGVRTCARAMIAVSSKASYTCPVATSNDVPVAAVKRFRATARMTKSKRGDYWGLAIINYGNNPFTRQASATRLIAIVYAAVR